jgi:antitoxin HigA-1
MRRLPKNRRPTPPGEVFLQDFLLPLGITQKEAASRLKISYPRMNEIVNAKRAVREDRGGNAPVSGRSGYGAAQRKE